MFHQATPAHGNLPRLYTCVPVSKLDGGDHGDSGGKSIEWSSENAL
jgi:hypothetical protein